MLSTLPVRARAWLTPGARVERYACALSRPQGHICHMRRSAAVLALVIGVLFLMNRQWMAENTLTNSPSFDALVYQNQSYDDYLVLRQSGLLPVLSSYASGRHSTPPLHTLSGTMAYALFGRDPANFYIVPALWGYLLVLGTYGFVHFWTARAALAAVTAALLVSVQSFVFFGLRVSQTDFSVGAAFVWATYLLVGSEGLRTRRATVIYAITVAACLLLKSSIALYFLAHAAILGTYLLLDPSHRAIRVRNALLIGVAVLTASGWFYAANYRQILAYYGRFGSELSGVARSYSGVCSTAPDALFYACSFAVFHLQGRHALAYLATGAVVAAVLIASLRLARRGLEVRPTVGVIVALLWLGVPYLVLTAYPSKTFSVDFPFLPTFFVLPALAAAIAFRGRWQALAPVLFLPLLLLLGRDQLQSLTVGTAREDWRERAVLADMFRDAEARGLGKFQATNAFIHAHLTSENLRFWVVNGTFAEWQERYGQMPLPYFFDAEAYYAHLLGADYILAKTGGLPLPHPNNTVAPAVNAKLAASSELSVVSRYTLPDRSEIILYRNVVKAGLSHPASSEDGWIGPRFPITFSGPPRARTVRIAGRVLLPPDLSYPARLFLEDAGGRVLAEGPVVPDGNPFDATVEVPANVLSGAGQPTTLYLNSDRVYRPSDHGVSPDARELMLLLSALEDAPSRPR